MYSFTWLVFETRPFYLIGFSMEGSIKVLRNTFRNFLFSERQGSYVLGKSRYLPGKGRPKRLPPYWEVEERCEGPAPAFGRSPPRCKQTRHAFPCRYNVTQKQMRYRLGVTLTQALAKLGPKGTTHALHHLKRKATNLTLYSKVSFMRFPKGTRKNANL